MQTRDNRLKNGWLSLLVSESDGKNFEKIRIYNAGRTVRHGMGFETFIDWALDCLFMALFLVLVIMTTLAYGL